MNAVNCRNTIYDNSAVSRAGRIRVQVVAWALCISEHVGVPANFTEEVLGNHLKLSHGSTSVAVVEVGVLPDLGVVAAPCGSFLKTRAAASDETGKIQGLIVSRASAVAGELQASASLVAMNARIDARWKRRVPRIFPGARIETDRIFPWPASA